MSMEIIKATLQRPIAFHRVFVDLTGSVVAALMLSQAYYWTPRTSESDGWFYKTQAEWEEETGLSRYEQEGARRTLRERGLMDEVRKGQPARLWYRVDIDAIANALSGGIMVGQQSSMRENPNLDCEEPSMTETAKLDWGKAPIQNAENQQSLTIQRLQAETTTETTSADALPARKQAQEPVPVQSLTTGGKMILFMGKKPETGGKSHAPKSGRGTEELLSWARARGFEDEAAVLDDWIEDCLLHWGKKKERMGDWEMACLKWIKDNIRRGGAYPTGGQANGRVQAPGPTGTGGRRYGYNDQGEPTNRATAYEENKRELERRQLARRMAEQAGGDVITLGPDEWRKLDPE